MANCDGKKCLRPTSLVSQNTGIALLGGFKPKVGEQYYLIPLAAVTKSGLNGQNLGWTVVTGIPPYGYHSWTSISLLCWPFTKSQ